MDIGVKEDEDISDFDETPELSKLEGVQDMEKIW